MAKTKPKLKKNTINHAFYTEWLTRIANTSTSSFKLSAFLGVSFLFYVVISGLSYMTHTHNQLNNQYMFPIETVNLPLFDFSLPVIDSDLDLGKTDPWVPTEPVGEWID